jgi:hypothetical protein
MVAPGVPVVAEALGFLVTGAKVDGQDRLPQGGGVGQRPRGEPARPAPHPSAPAPAARPGSARTPGPGPGSRPAAALAGGLDGAVPDGLGVARRHPKAVATERLAQRRPGRAQLGGGRVDRAEAFGQGEGTLGLSAVGQEAAALPAQRTSAGDRLVLGRQQGGAASIGSYLRIGSLIGYVRSFDIRIITMMRFGWEHPARRPRITRRWWAPPGMQDEESQPP